MKFLAYLKEGSDTTRMRKVPIEKFKKEVATKCKGALKAPPIYRGVYTPVDFAKVEPQKFTRESANTYNWYTLIINNAPAWKPYPKRNLICSTSKDYASGYGHLFRVLPVDGSKIGICSQTDLWDSFPKIVPPYSSMNAFNHDLTRVLENATGNMRIVDFDNSWKDFKEACSKVTLEFSEDNAYLLNKFFTIGFIPGRHDFFDFLLKALDPKENKFMLTTINDLHPIYSQTENEVWVSSTCYMVLYENWEVVQNEITPLSN